MTPQVLYVSHIKDDWLMKSKGVAILESRLWSQKSLEKHQSSKHSEPFLQAQFIVRKYLYQWHECKGLVCGCFYWMLSTSPQSLIAPEEEILTYMTFVMPALLLNLFIQQKTKICDWAINWSRQNFSYMARDCKEEEKEMERGWSHHKR